MFKVAKDIILDNLEVLKDITAVIYNALVMYVTVANGMLGDVPLPDSLSGFFESPGISYSYYESHIWFLFTRIFITIAVFMGFMLFYQRYRAYVLRNQQKEMDNLQRALELFPVTQLSMRMAEEEWDAKIAKEDNGFIKKRMNEAKEKSMRILQRYEDTLMKNINKHPDANI